MERCMWLAVSATSRCANSTRTSTSYANRMSSRTRTGWKAAISIRRATTTTFTPPMAAGPADRLSSARRISSVPTRSRCSSRRSSTAHPTPCIRAHWCLCPKSPLPTRATKARVSGGPSCRRTWAHWDACLTCNPSGGATTGPLWAVRESPSRHVSNQRLT